MQLHSSTCSVFRHSQCEAPQSSICCVSLAQEIYLADTQSSLCCVSLAQEISLADIDELKMYLPRYLTNDLFKKLLEMEDGRGACFNVCVLS